MRFTYALLKYTVENRTPVLVRYQAEICIKAALAPDPRGYFSSFRSQLANSESFWAGIHRAAGSSSTFAKLMGDLNEHIRQNAGGVEVEKLDSSVVSAVTNGTETRLFVTWKSDEGAYLMKEVRGYMLSQEDQYIRFPRAVRNILDWGLTERLKAIRPCLKRMPRDQGRKVDRRGRGR